MEASNMQATGAAASIYDETTTNNLNSKIIAANITHVEQNKSNDYNKHIFATNSYARRDQNWQHCCCSCKDISVKLEEATHKHENEVCGESGCTNAQQQKRNHQHMRQKQDYQQQSYTQVSTTGKAKLSILHCCMSTTAAEVGCGNDDFIKKSDSAAITVPQRQLGRHRYKQNTSVHHGFGDSIPLTPINGGDVSACYTTATGTTMSAIKSSATSENTAASNIFPKMLPTIKATAPAQPTPSYNKQQQWQHQHTNSETSEFRDSSYNYSHNLLPIAGSSDFDSHIYANQIKSRCMTSSHHFNRSRSRNYFSIMCGSKLHSSSNRRIAKVNRIGLRSLIIILLSLSQIKWTHALLMVEPAFIGLSTIGGGDIASRSTDDLNSKNVLNSNNSSSHNRQNIKSLSDSSNIGDIAGSTGSTTAAVGVVGSAAAVPGGYLDKLDNLERSVAAVLIKVAYGTTSTTKRSIPDNSYVPSLTTIATPLLTTLRYFEKSSHQQQINIHHRNYELDLERDHALPTSAPNADILKSNSNPTYPNPNRHHNHDRERHRHIINSTPLPSLPNILKKSNGQSPTIPMYPGDIPSYSPPARSFFTPPLPPEYQNPFADKPTLRGTNNEGIVANTGTYINRRPIPPPSLMPGHERIPFRPPDLAASTGGNGNSQVGSVQSAGSAAINPAMSSSVSTEAERKKALNTPSRNNGSGDGGGLTRGQPAATENKSYYDTSIQQDNTLLQSSSGAVSSHNSQQEVLPSIRRILSGSNGNKGEIPEVLLKQATSRPIISYHQPPSSPVVLFDSGISNSTVQQNSNSEDVVGSGSSNINKSKNTSDNEGLDSGEGKLQGKNRISAKSSEHTQNGLKGNGSSTPATAAAIDGGEEKVAVAAETSSTASTMSSTTVAKNETQIPGSGSSGGHIGGSDGSSSTTAAAASTNSTWAVAWNIHVYFSVVLFTILAVYSLYKVLTYNKLTHLFSQSYFVCIHLILIVICSARIFYLCYDAYNIHATFSIFVSEVLLNLPATFLTISFSVLILFLFLKALNHKNNRYSALIRPLTVVVGCGVHVVLCITLHYVESYTLQNQQQQHLFYQQQQQLLYRRQQQQLLQQHQMHHQQYVAAANLLTHTSSSSMYAALLLQQSSAATTASITASAPPPRVLSLICQIIYIFVCLFLGLLYLYLYRILKRILRSKSQNYIHGYQNLSYAIHITIATALLFVLLAVLQIFGAISISTTRPLIQQLTAEIDWLQWGYQFSLRLIEIAIITLLSWVAGLKTSGGGPGGGIGGGGSSLGIGDARYGGAHGGGGNVVFGGGNSSVPNREKHAHHHHHNHSNVAGFFLPCTSSSSQEQFDTDYPAVCNANTNLHTYTMRTGKLIYDDSFALNSLSGGGSGQSSQLVSVSGVPSVRNAGEFQLQSQPTYQRPYDTGSLHSSAAASHTVADYGTQSTLTGGANRYHQETPQYADYLTDATTDHYENPNFDLHGSVSGSGSGMAVNNSMQKFAKTSTTSTTASSSGGSGSSAASQQQMLLLQSDSCYSEPLQPPAHASSYDINNFEGTQLSGIGNSSGGGVSGPALMDWIEPLHAGQPLSRALDGHHSKREKKSSHTHTTLDRSVYENPERRSSNSSHSCVTSSGRYVSYNSFDRSGPYNGVRKSGTLNNIAGGSSGSTGNGVVAGMGIIHGRNSSSSSAASSNVSTTMASSQRASGVQTLADRHHHQQQHNNQRGSRNSGNAVRNGIISSGVREHDVAMFGRSSLERDSNHKLQVHQQQQQNSDDDMMLSGSNVERTNLINNEDGSCIINSNTTFNIGGIGSQLANELNGAANTTTTERLLGKAPLKNSYDSSSHSSGNIYLQANYHPNQNAPIPSHTHNKQQRQLPSNSDSSGLTNLGVSASSTSKNSGTSSIVLDSVNVGTGGSNGEVLVSEHGFVRFRALDDMNNAQGVGIHNASVRNNQS